MQTQQTLNAKDYSKADIKDGMIKLECGQEVFAWVIWPELVLEDLDVPHILAWAHEIESVARDAVTNAADYELTADEVARWEQVLAEDSPADIIVTFKRLQLNY